MNRQAEGFAMFKLKKLSKEAIKAAQIKAVRYRILNEPLEAESICRDILDVDPDNQSARITFLLALTEQFSDSRAQRLDEALEVAERLQGEYERCYYNGIISERHAKSIHSAGKLGSGPVVYDWLRQAMEWYEKAEEVRPEGNDDAILRWNTCARIIERHSEVRPQPAEDDQPPLMLE
jgi:hypothetical protein